MHNGKWRDAFPFDEAEQVVGSIKTTWDYLIKQNFKGFQPRTHEPQLTIKLKLLLQSLCSEYGLTGYFTAEEVSGHLNLDTGEIENSGRTDIKYISRRVEEEFTFEFKKVTLKSDSRRKYHIDGIMRFVTGKYSPKKHFDFMVGIIVNECDAKKIYDSLVKSFAKPDLRAVLHMLEDESGKYIRKPSKELPDCTLFDTKHARTLVPGSPDIIICHFYLSHIK